MAATFAIEESDEDQCCMNRISLVGYGRLASTLIPPLLDAGVSIVQWHIRNVSLHEEVTDLFHIQPIADINSLIEDADAIWLMVPDQVIAEVSASISRLDIPHVHTSGATPIDVLSSTNKGLFYPLNTFTGDQQPWNQDIPIIVQSNDVALKQDLTLLAHRLSTQVPAIRSEDMIHLHIAAVFAQNFSNHLIHLAEDYLEHKKLNRSLLTPLLNQMIVELRKRPAGLNQTGPAIRKDTNTIQAHEEVLAARKDLLSIYRMLTASIQSSDSELATKSE